MMMQVMLARQIPPERMALANLAAGRPRAAGATLFGVSLDRKAAQEAARRSAEGRQVLEVRIPPKSAEDPNREADVSMSEARLAELIADIKRQRRDKPSPSIAEPPMTEERLAKALAEAKGS
jgi:hypothetical protein